MPSLNLDIDYFSHPKTRRLVRLLGKGSEVLPLRLWCFTARYFAKDGRLTGISTQEIEDECQWWGERGSAVKAMMDPQAIFLELDGDTYVVHDWLDHEGHIFAFRERAKLGAAEKWRRYREEKGNASSSASSTASSNALTYNTNQLTNKKPKSAAERAAEEAVAHLRKKGKL